MEVSVIIRTRNRNLLLARALRSVLRQTYRDLEVVVINDGGDSIAFRSAVEAGLAACRGDMVCIHDDDDTWDPHFVEALAARCIAAREAIPNVVGCICGLVRIYEEITETGVPRTLREEMPGPENAAKGLVKFARYLLQREDFYPIQCMFDKAAALEAGGFDSTFAIFEDRHLFIRLLARGEFCVEPRKLAFHHVRTERSTGGALANATSDKETVELYFALLENVLLRGCLPGVPPGSAAGLTPLVKAIAEARAMPAPRRGVGAFLRQAIAACRRQPLRGGNAPS
jgi:glycosyltransferase involved in cell wall biosynthesis